MSKRLFIIGLLSCTLCSHAQVSSPLTREALSAQFQHWETRLGKLNYSDPDIISLHYLFLKDITREMDDFKRETLPQIIRNYQLDYYDIKADFQKTEYHAQQAGEKLLFLKNHVDRIFYSQAVEELEYQDTARAFYFLDRALQYNPHFPEALLLKARLELDNQEYQKAVELVHILYSQTTLTEKQEQAVSDFTIILYDRLYNLGTTLVNSGKAADALEVFLALEQFCSNMPSGYCNDDYYHGILLSRQGVYESYLSIAREAERRHNMELAKKFYKYAEEYRSVNREEKE